MSNFLSLSARSNGFGQYSASRIGYNSETGQFRAAFRSGSTPFGQLSSSNPYQNNLFAGNYNGTNLFNAQMQNPFMNAQFTGINNHSTGTRIGAYSGQNPFGNFNGIMASGDDLNFMGQRNVSVDTPNFHGNRSTTWLEDDDNYYRIRQTQGVWA
ncbi:MAG TPA: hypothetical protein P5556_03225 [Candidatus Gastranaerophilales bacterium]|nr:hypothetical protein [Candidatus Gastranaerophilales bacterium]